jgi:hypothetical protein
MSSMIVRVALVLSCLTAIAANCSSNRTCLDIQLVDMYGDGWDGEKFFVETPWDEMFSDAPTCGNREISHTFCTDATGNYPMMLIHENESYTPENYWEDLFTVTVSKCNETVAKYTGGYNSTLIFHYEAQSDDWSVMYWENLWENEKSCDSCGNAKACAPKKPKSKKRTTKPSSSITRPISSSYANTTKYSKKKPRYGPPAVNVRVSMFGDGWWKNNYRGASWYLADDRRTTLFETGSLESSSDGPLSTDVLLGPDDDKRSKRSDHQKSKRENSGYCNLCLGDGTYSMRFSGASTPDTTVSTWDFCGVQGDHGQELTFHVKKGKCIPDSLLGLEADCYGTVISTIVVTGVVNLVGLTSEFIESSQYSILPGVLADSVVGWEAKNIEVQSTTLTSRALSSLSSRQLAEFDVDVQFTASFESETDYGVEGRLFSKVENLIDTLQDSLTTKISSESFSISLTQSAVLAGAESLERVQSAELVSLELESITYEGVQTMRSSTLPAFDEAEYWGTSSLVNVSLYNVGSISIFVVAIAAGFVAFVGLVSHSMNGYKRISQLSDSMHDVQPSEMDSTISDPLATNKGSLRTELATSL